ncbi:MAG: PAS domain S-box protein [Acidobacteria bacterium]|nr:PAS domain S-box protein [Acidobacteriota bacterium]
MPSKRGERGRRSGQPAAPALETTFRLICDLASDGIVMHELVSPARGQFIYANPAICELLGIPVEGMHKLTPLDILDRREFELLPDDSARLARDGSLLHHKTLVAGDGTRIPVEIHSWQFERDGRQLIVSVIRDQTRARLKLDQERLRQALRLARSFAFEWFPLTDEVLRSADCAEILALRGNEEVTRDTGQGYFRRIHADDRERFVALVSALTPANDTYSATYRLVRHDGTTIVLEETGRGAFDEQGRLVHVYGVTADITEREQNLQALRDRERLISRQLAEIEAIYDSAQVALCVFDSELRFLRANRLMAEINGVPASAHIGRTVREIVPDLAPLAEELAERIFRTGEPVRDVEFAGTTPAQPGVPRWWREQWWPLKVGEGQVIGIAVAAEEITERKLAQQRLHRAMEELARSNKDLEQFAYAVSHDLKEPLRTMRSFLQLLSRKYRGKLDPTGDEYIDFATDAGARMSELIDALLNFSRVNTLAGPAQPVAVGEALALALAALHTPIAESEAVIAHDELPTVLADKSQLTQLLQNLVGNAIKFRQPGAVPHVHVGAARDGEWWRLSVSDDGIGIEPQFQERVFAIFQRLHTRSEYPGTGVGLAICKRIVERHDGRIWVESTPGAGATFHFTLPAAP